MNQLNAPARVLVTGAAGFLGTHVLAALLDRGYEVVALRHRTIVPATIGAKCAQVFLGDICDPESLREALENVEGVCHLAAYIPERIDDMREAETCYRINGLATLTLAAAALQRGVQRFVYVSSGNMYARSDRNCMETDPVFPSETATSYFASKLAGELYVTHVFQRTAAAAVILRMGTPYGPSEPDGKVVKTFMRCAAQGQPLKILHGGITKYNFVHVDDVAECVAHALQDGPPGIYNVASGEHTSLRHLADTVAEIYTDRKVTICVEPAKPNSPTGFSALSIDKARDLWGYKPRSLHDGLRRYRARLGDSGCSQ